MADLLSPEKGDPCGVRGSVSVLMVMILPAMLIATALAIDIGMVAWARAAAQAAADLAALAAVQEIDLDLLAQGKRRLIEDIAVDRAHAVVRDNIARSGPALGPASQVAITVLVLNPGEDGAVTHPRDGKRLSDPTVCVTVETRTWLPLLSAMGHGLVVGAHADASVVERRR